MACWRWRPRPGPSPAVGAPARPRSLTPCPAAGPPKYPSTAGLRCCSPAAWPTA
ncbi:MAG: hypothetical protein WKG07_20285 [Hymenobacter sp.]